MSDYGASNKTKLDLFAAAFKSEDDLRKSLAELFRRMKHTGVRITHGSLEKGKDIVFFGKGPLKEHRLFACVVKNAPITGQASAAHTTSLSIMHQVNQAFDEPLTGPKGEELWVDSVYVLTPYECGIATMDAIKGQLRRSGQVVFTCGHGLLELYAEHWPEFLWFESNVLLSYLATMQKQVSDDYGLAALILRRSLMPNAPGSVFDYYVDPSLELAINEIDVVHEMPSLGALQGKTSDSEIKEILEAIRRSALLLRNADLWCSQDVVKQANLSAPRLMRLHDDIEACWEDGFRRFAGALFGKVSSLSHWAQDPDLESRPEDIVGQSRKGISIEMVLPGDVKLEAIELLERLSPTLLGPLRSDVDDANNFVKDGGLSSIAFLADERVPLYNRIAMLANSVPAAFEVQRPKRNVRLPEDLFEQYRGHLLVTAPAGFGKTTLCRWHALNDATRLVRGDAVVLPVYTPLHSLPVDLPPSPIDAFFRSDALKALLHQRGMERLSFDRIRLYLDGLDEVTPTMRQERVAQLAEQAAKKIDGLQIVITTREHVRASSLNWLPRARISQLDPGRLAKLSERWLGANKTSDFITALNASGGLRGIVGVPLLATLVLAVYKTTGTIPANKTYLYGLFIELLCGGWDVYKKVQRGSQFGIQAKLIVLTRLAAMLHLSRQRDGSDADFRAAIAASLSGIADQWEAMLNEILEDGILVRSGTALTFSHLSFQEYLAARDLLDPTGVRPAMILKWYTTGEDWWREVLSFYVTLVGRPAEVEEWIVKEAGLHGRAKDLWERTRYLREALSSAFPGYEPTVSARLEDRLRGRANMD